MQNFPVDAVVDLAFVRAVDTLIVVLMARLAVEQVGNISKIASTMITRSTKGSAVFTLMAKFKVITLAESTV